LHSGNAIPPPNVALSCGYPLFNFLNSNSLCQSCHIPPKLLVTRVTVLFFDLNFPFPQKTAQSNVAHRSYVLSFFTSDFLCYGSLRGFCILIKITCSPYDGQRTDTFLDGQALSPCDAQGTVRSLTSRVRPPAPGASRFLYRLTPNWYVARSC
jgi:hypothetical protein